MAAFFIYLWYGLLRKEKNKNLEIAKVSWKFGNHTNMSICQFNDFGHYFMCLVYFILLFFDCNYCNGQELRRNPNVNLPFEISLGGPGCCPCLLLDYAQLSNLQFLTWGCDGFFPQKALRVSSFYSQPKVRGSNFGNG